MYIFYYHLPVFRFGLWVLVFCCDAMPCVVSYVPVSCAVLGYCELSRVVTYCICTREFCRAVKYVPVSCVVQWHHLYRVAAVYQV